MTGLVGTRLRGQLSLELPEVAEVDVNPVRVADDAVRAADALVVLGAS